MIRLERKKKQIKATGVKNIRNNKKLDLKKIHKNIKEKLMNLKNCFNKS